MYPYDILPGVDLYSIMFCLGIIAAMLTFRICSDKRDLSARLNNFVIIDGVFAVIAGYASAILFQAVYNALAGGKFEIKKNTGATFYGGFIGGAVVFLSIYFIAGHFVFRGGEHLGRLTEVTSVAAASVCLAHSLGRIGCLFAGCCYGRVSDSPIAVYNAHLDAHVIPVQLFEALFLGALFAFLVWRLHTGRDLCLPLYLSIYGVWRFFIEYLRTDERGGSPVSFLTPSQFTAVILALLGIALFFVERRLRACRPAHSTPDTPCEPDAGES